MQPRKAASPITEVVVVEYVKSSDATLSDLTVDGTTIESFAAETLTYNVELAAGTTEVPTIIATATDDRANAVVTPAESLSGATTILVTAEDGTTTKTYTIKFTVANVDQDAPTNLEGVAPTSVANSDGKITGTTTAMEYKLQGATDWTEVTGTEISGLAAGTYEVRYAAKEGFNAGTVAEVEVPAYVESSDATLSGLTIDGTTVTDFDAATETYDVELAAGTTGVPTVAATTVDEKATAEVTAAESLPGSTTVVVTAEDGTTTKTYTINFTVANADQDAPEGLAGVAPTSVANNDGRITGTTTEMEYRLNDATDWTAVTGTEITSLAAGTYEVRLAAKEGYNASLITEVVVPEYVAPTYVLTLTGENITSDPAAGDLAAGTEVTVTVAPAEGKQVATLTVGGEDKKDELAGNKYTFNMPAMAILVAVTYEAIPAVDPMVGEAVSATAVTVGDVLSISTLSGTFKNASGDAVEGTLAWTDGTVTVDATGNFG